MDLQQLLNTKIESLTDGDHKLGLKSVSLHIEAAVRHYVRGQESDDTLFTDAIYRCNQAFEGSIKEAYRVLAEKPPERKTPDEIEKFLNDGKVLRARVLAQFKNYRQEWRNPAAHDYTLDFDEDEALLAINSVTVFSMVLCDQIDSKLAFVAAAKEAAEAPTTAINTEDLLLAVGVKIKEFANSQPAFDPSVHPARVSQRLEAELAGFLASEFQNRARVEVNTTISNHTEADIVVSNETLKIAIELKVKTTSGSSLFITERGKMAATRYLAIPEINGAILAVFGLDGSKYELSETNNESQKRLLIVSRSA